MALVPGNATRLNSITLARRLVDAGYSVLSCDFGGSHTWGNDTAMSRITDAVTWAGTLGYRTDKVGLWGYSMGHLNLYNWAHRNATKVACLIGYIPASDGQDAYDNAGVAVEMDAAYAGGGAANASARDPKQITNVVSGLPWRAYYSSDDTTVPAATVTGLASSLGKATQAVNLGAGGHDDDVAANIDPGAFLAFIDAGNW